MSNEPFEEQIATHGTFQTIPRFIEKTPKSLLRPKWELTSRYPGWVKLRILSPHLNTGDVESLIRALRDTISQSKRISVPDAPVEMLEEEEVTVSVEPKPKLSLSRKKTTEEEILPVIEKAKLMALEWLRNNGSNKGSSYAQIFKGLAETGNPVSNPLLRTALDRLEEERRITKTGHGGKGRGCHRYSISSSDEAEKC